MPPDVRRPRTFGPGPVVWRKRELPGDRLRLGRGLGAAPLARGLASVTGSGKASTFSAIRRSSSWGIEHGLQSIPTHAGQSIAHALLAGAGDYPEALTSPSNAATGSAARERRSSPPGPSATAIQSSERCSTASPSDAQRTLSSCQPVGSAAWVRRQASVKSSVLSGATA